MLCTYCTSPRMQVLQAYSITFLVHTCTIRIKHKKKIWGNNQNVKNTTTATCYRCLLVTYQVKHRISICTSVVLTREVRFYTLKLLMCTICLHNSERQKTRIVKITVTGYNTRVDISEYTFRRVYICQCRVYVNQGKIHCSGFKLHATCTLRNYVGNITFSCCGTQPIKNEQPGNVSLRLEVYRGAHAYTKSNIHNMRLPCWGKKQFLGYLTPTLTGISIKLSVPIYRLEARKTHT